MPGRKGRGVSTESRSFLLRCPHTGLMVHVEISGQQDQTTQSRNYVGAHCKACGGWHFVNPKTGKLMSDETQVRG